MVNIDKTLCKQCNECKTHIYKRIDKNGNIVRFDYCNGNKNIIDQYNWNISDKGYPKTTICIGKSQKTLNSLLNNDNNLMIDHHDGKRLNNIMKNLREITPRCNAQNLHIDKLSNFNNVSFSKNKKSFRSYVTVNNQQISLGHFPDEFQAYHAFIIYCNKFKIPYNKELDCYKKYQKWLKSDSFIFTGKNKIKSNSNFERVTKHSKTNKYHSNIRIKGKNKFLGTFDTALEAFHQYQLEYKKEYKQYNCNAIGYDEWISWKNSSDFKFKGRSKLKSKSGYSNVYKLKNNNYEAYMTYEKKRYSLGRYNNELSAFDAYQRFYYSKYGKLNEHANGFDEYIKCLENGEFEKYE